MKMTVPISSKHEEEFDRCTSALIPDMPLLMYGAGDVTPDAVDKESAALVARLTTEYITQLCCAAVDAHDILSDGAGGLLPPPALEKKLIPLPYSEEQKNKRRKPGEEYWDDPLPNPNKKGSASTPKLDYWVGLHGVDLQQTSRIRQRHIQNAIETQSFVFPICHDSELYQRVVHLQAARREVHQVLENGVIMDLIQEEIAKQKDDEEDVDDLVDPEWPGMEGLQLLPIHKKYKFE